jgi:hypothetical protein
MPPPSDHVPDSLLQTMRTARVVIPLGCAPDIEPARAPLEARTVLAFSGGLG